MWLGESHEQPIAAKVDCSEGAPKGANSTFEVGNALIRMVVATQDPSLACGSGELERLQLTLFQHQAKIADLEEQVETLKERR